MLQDISPLCFSNRFPGNANAAEKKLFLFYKDTLLVEKADTLGLPDLTLLSAANARYAFGIDNCDFYIADTSDPTAPTGYQFLSSRQYRYMSPGHYAFACGVGESLHRFYRGTRFCGICGASMNDSATERARVCPRCGNTVYPKISPAIIAGVYDGDRLLLTKYAGRSFRQYALVAGFNEIGETIEQTVHREVWEETGLRVKHLQFYKSQPWMFTDSLLMGFFCELDGPSAVRLQDNELAEATWFPRQCLPEDHSGISLTGEMIEAFRKQAWHD